jgi:hypothetical protein
MSFLLVLFVVLALLLVYYLTRKTASRPLGSRLIRAMEILVRHRRSYTIEQSFKFQGTTLLPAFRPTLWLGQPGAEYPELLALYPELKVSIAGHLVDDLGLSPDHVYLSLRQPFNLPNRYLKFGSDGQEEYMLVRDPGSDFPPSIHLRELLHQPASTHYSRYFVVPGKKLDYKLPLGLTYRPNVFLDQMRPYVEGSALRHIQLQAADTTTFYFQQLQPLESVLTNEAEWRTALLRGSHVITHDPIISSPVHSQHVGDLYDSSLDQMKYILGPGLHYHAGSDGGEDSPVVKSLYPYIGPNARILDIGCGWGGTLNMLRRDLTPRCVAGITNSRVQADYCYQELLLSDVYHGDAAALEVPGHFDCTLMLECYSHLLPASRSALLRRVYAQSDRLIMRVNCNLEPSSQLVFGDTMLVPTVGELRADLVAAGWHVVRWENCRDTQALESVARWYAKCQSVPHPSPHVRVLARYCQRVLGMRELWQQHHPLVELVCTRAPFPLHRVTSPLLAPSHDYRIEDSALPYLPILAAIVAQNYPANPVQTKANGLFLAFPVSELEQVCNRLGPALSLPLRKVQPLFAAGSRLIFNISILPPVAPNSTEDYVLKPHHDTYYTKPGHQSSESPIFNAITYLGGCDYDNGSLVVFQGTKTVTIHPRPGRMVTLFGKVLHAVKSNHNYFRVTTQVALFA